MNTIAVFGATGRTGIPFITKALDQGYQIRALIRTPDRAPLQHAKLTWIAGDVLNPSAVETTLAGTQAVISLIGHVKNSPAHLQTDAIRLVMDRMKAQGISRLISLTGGGVRDGSTDKPGFADNAIVFVMRHLAGKETREALEDGIDHAALIQKSGLQWTIVRGPMLTNEPEKGTYQVGSVGTVKGFKLTRADLATFILRALTEETHIGEMPFVAN